MKISLLDKYIAKTVLASIALVTLVLSGLQIFILFVNQLDDLGKANFGFIQAASFVLLQLPYQVYLFFPMASLLGCLIGLGVMANHRELVVMRAAGMSIAQVTIAVLKAAAIVILIVTVLSETLIPQLSKIGNDQKTQAISSGQTYRGSHSVWVRFHNDFISIGSVLPNNTLENIYQFHFTPNHQLLFARYMQKVVYNANGWVASDVSETQLQGDKTVANYQKSMLWEVMLNPDVLNMNGKESEEMTIIELKKFLKEQKKNHQLYFSYQLSYWQRIVQPFTTVVMMILAIPFIFGPLRSSSMGSKLLAGALVGFSFHIINRFFGPISQVFQWPAEIAAIVPTVLFAVIGIILMRKAR
jgi:lipopolysaccharide export system permease protein